MLLEKPTLPNPVIEPTLQPPFPHPTEAEFALTREDIHTIGITQTSA